MFTGIVTDVGQVCTVAETPGGRRFVIGSGFGADTLFPGESIACAGCCLTVVEADGAGGFAVDVSPETLARTTIGQWQAGTDVNLERALRMGDALGGHMVSGHVDDVALCVAVEADGECWRLSIQVPDPLARFIAPKGSVALDGVSLTVNAVAQAVFGVCIIPYTWSHTTFHTLKAGSRMNLEVDLMARYVQRMMEAQ